jgi:APA family basic amino acid/polyamine antiporter
VDNRTSPWSVRVDSAGSEMMASVPLIKRPPINTMFTVKYLELAIIAWLILGSDKRIFPRSTSGLERSIGPITAVLITIGYTVGVVWQRQIYLFPGQSPLPENLWFAGIPPVVMSLLIVGIIMILITLGYSILLSAMPRSGGGYVAISRIVSPFAAFIGSWFEFVSIAGTFGVIAVFVFQASPLAAGPVGFNTPILTSNDVGFFAAGVLLVVLMTGVASLGARITGYVLQVLIWVPAVLGLYVFGLLTVAVASPSTLQSGISLWAQGFGMTGVSADTYVKAALTQGLDSANVGNYWTAVSVSLLGAYFSYVGYAATTFVVGEVKDPKRNLPKVLLITPVVVMVMYVMMAAFGTYSAAAVGQTTLANGNKWSFYEAYSYLSYGGGNLQQAGVPNIQVYAVTIGSMVETSLGLGSLKILLFIFTILWIVNDIPPMILAGSRTIFAMSFDGLLPASLSRVDNRFHTPFYAILLVGIFGVLGALTESCVFCTGGSWSPSGVVGDMLANFFANGPIYNIDLLDVTFFSLFSLAVVLFPFRLKQVFAAAPFKPGGKLGVVAIGLSGLIANLIIAWTVLTSPQDVYSILSPTPANWYALEWAGLLGIIGALIYAYYRFGPSRKKTDYSTIFSEIPPG